MLQILVIDDDPTIRMTLQRFLKSQGYDAIVANDGEEGLAKAREIHPSLIICDWMMPIIDGLEVCRQIKSNPELAKQQWQPCESVGKQQGTHRELTMN